jgi:micrococcal nuclease
MATLASTATPTRTPTPSSGNCAPSYPTVCIPPPPPDLNCGDIPYTDFIVLPPDPHGFDGDFDGIGCESG